ncbi:metal-dependent hydrolase, partial [Staphylococcus aureus]|nr:metal-dependent hydrolase [Staphylococcus aureus]
MTGKTHASCGMLVGALTTQYFQTDIFSSVTVITVSYTHLRAHETCADLV